MATESKEKKEVRELAKKAEEVQLKFKKLFLQFCDFTAERKAGMKSPVVMEAFVKTELEVIGSAASILSLWMESYKGSIKEKRPEEGGS